MNTATAPGAQKGRCACTLPFSLHLTVMILGIVGFILGVVVTIIVFRFVSIWLLISTVLVFASGLQGLLVVPGSGCFNCHVVLAVINLVNLGVFGVACIFLGGRFWIIWVVAVFVMELWVTIARFCCKTGTQAGVVGTGLPVAMPQPNVVHVVQPQPNVVHVVQPQPNVVHFAQPQPNVVHVAQPQPNVVHVAQPQPNVVHVAQPQPNVVHIAQPQPNVVHVVQGQPMPPTYTVNPRGGHYQKSYKQPNADQ